LSELEIGNRSLLTLSRLVSRSAVSQNSFILSLFLLLRCFGSFPRREDLFDFSGTGCPQAFRFFLDDCSGAGELVSLPSSDMGGGVG